MINRRDCLTGLGGALSCFFAGAGTSQADADITEHPNSIQAYCHPRWGWMRSLRISVESAQPAEFGPTWRSVAFPKNMEVTVEYVIHNACEEYTALLEDDVDASDLMFRLSNNIADCLAIVKYNINVPYFRFDGHDFKLWLTTTYTGS
jgi:hypothetical protein